MSMLLASHCSEDTCHQANFLPFKCEFCHNVYCDSHHLVDSHSCSNAEKAKAKDSHVPQCPICSQLVSLKTPSEDPNHAVNRHIDAGCPTEQKNSTRYHCKVKGCKVKEFVLNPCRECGIHTCFTHRAQVSHSCVSLKNRKIEIKDKTKAPGKKRMTVAGLAALERMKAQNAKRKFK